MKTKYAIPSVLLALVSFGTLAGDVRPAPLTYDPAGQFAFGDMATVRFSREPGEFIGCGVRYESSPDGVYKWGFCQAGNSLDDSFTCFTDNPALLEAMQSQNDYSFITFTWNEAGECTNIGFSTQSWYIPEHLDKPGKK